MKLDALRCSGPARITKRGVDLPRLVRAAAVGAPKLVQRGSIRRAAPSCAIVQRDYGNQRNNNNGNHGPIIYTDRLGVVNNIPTTDPDPIYRQGADACVWAVTFNLLDRPLGTRHYE